MPKQARALDKRSRILAAAMHRFAQAGYEATRVEDVAAELAIAKGSVFQHFGSKERLFLAAYRQAVESLPRYLDAPLAVQRRGFFATLRYWLERTGHLLREDIISYRLTLIGNYGSDLLLHREINRYLAREDPYGTLAFVRAGLKRGELRRDVAPELMASLLDWTVERFQDSLLARELFPNALRKTRKADQSRRRITEFLRVLEGALGAPRRGRARGLRKQGRNRLLSPPPSPRWA
jgi:AcrR family transcriptional regulator